MLERLAGCSILIADTNPTTRAVLATMATHGGARVLATARSPTEAFAAVERLKPDIAVFDLLLLGSPLPQTLRVLIREHPDTAFVVMGTDDERAKARDAMDSGALGYVTKPLNEARVLASLTQVHALMGCRKAPHPPPGRDGAQRHAVIIDHDSLARGLLRVILEDDGFLVVAEAASGFEGLMAVERHAADFVCVAVDLPEIDGLNAVACLRAVHPDLPILMVTSHADRETVSAAIRNGIDDYIIKPFDPARIVASIRRAIA